METGGTGVTIINPICQGDPADCTIIAILDRIIDFILLISVPILAIMILIGGFYILTARDNKEKVVTGRKVIYYAVIGFTIILISKGVSLIILEILGA